MAEPIGEITILHGKAVAEGPDGARELAVGSPIYNNETISTGLKGAIEIQFTDGALLSQGPNSKVHLDDYVFDPDNDMGEITMDLMEGTFRSVTGQIVDMNPEGFKIDTPNTTIGIRGTTTGHVVRADGQEDHVVIDFDGKPVVVQPDVGGPPAVITRDGMGVPASREGVGSPRPASEGMLRDFDQLSSDSLEESAPQFTSGEMAEGEQGQEDGGPEDAIEEVTEEVNEEGIEEGVEEEIEEVILEPVEEIIQEIIDEAIIIPVIDGTEGGGTITVIGGTGGGSISGVVKETERIIDDEKNVTQETVLDLSAETDPVTVNLVGGSPPYWEITGDSSTRVDIDETVFTVIGSQTQPNDITGDEQNNILTGGQANDTITGGDGNDTISGLGDNNMSGGGDSLDGGAGVGDLLSYANLGVAISKTSETEVSYTQGASQLDTIAGFEHFEGTNHFDVIYGDSGNNMLSGLVGNDFLWGGSGGADSLFGGSGDDTLKVEGIIVGGVLDGGDGSDTIQVYSSANLSALSSVKDVEKFGFQMGDKVLTIEARDFTGFDAGAGDYTIFGMDGNHTFNVNAGATLPSDETINLSSMTFDSWTSSDLLNINGNSGKDVLTGAASVAQTISGGAGNDALYGGSANDTLNGGDDNDKLFGSAGNDSMDGGAGVDIVSYINAGSGVTANLGSGANNVSIDGNGGQDTILNFEVFEGSNSGDVITTSNDSTVSQKIYTREGNDWVKYVTNGNNQGMEIDLGDGADKMGIDGNIANGSSLNGCAGDDTLECNGNAVVDGTGLGSIQYVEHFWVSGGATSLSMSYAAVTSQSWAASISNGCTLTVKGDGNANAIDMSTYDSLNLNTSGSLVINGDSGNDSLDMGSYMSSLVTYDGGADSDSLKYKDTGGSNELDNVTNVENIAFHDGSNVNVTTVNNLVASGQTLNVSGANLSSSYSLTWEGWAEMDGRFNITGGAGGDQIYGGAGNDYISGGAGADYLRGGDGTDMIYGGAGADTYAYEMPNQGGDGLKDFNAAEDLFHFNKSDFDGWGSILSTGTLNSDYFTVVTDAAYLMDGVTGLGTSGDMNGANDHFVYFKEGGTYELYYDADGDGGANHTLIASFDEDVSLTNADIIMV